MFGFFRRRGCRGKSCGQPHCQPQPKPAPPHACPAPPPCPAPEPLAGKTLWVAGRVSATVLIAGESVRAITAWHPIGLFETEAQAEAACDSKYCFVGELQVGERLPAGDWLVTYPLEPETGDCGSVTTQPAAGE